MPPFKPGICHPSALTFRTYLIWEDLPEPASIAHTPHPAPLHLFDPLIAPVRARHLHASACMGGKSPKKKRVGGWRAKSVLPACFFWPHLRHCANVLGQQNGLPERGPLFRRRSAGPAAPPLADRSGCHRKICTTHSLTHPPPPRPTQYTTV